MGGPNSPRSSGWPPPQTVCSQEQGSEQSPPLSPRSAVPEALPAPVVPPLWGLRSRNPHHPQFGGQAEASHVALPQAALLPPCYAQLLNMLRGDIESSLRRYDWCLQRSLVEDGLAAQKSKKLRTQPAGCYQRIPRKDANVGMEGQASRMVDDLSNQVSLLDVSANIVRGEDELAGAVPWPDEPPKPYQPHKKGVPSSWAEAGIVLQNPCADSVQDATSHAARPTVRRSTPAHDLGKQDKGRWCPSQSSHGSSSEGELDDPTSHASDLEQDFKHHASGLDRVIDARRSSQFIGPLDASIREIIDKPRRNPFLQRLSEFRFNAKPLVSEDSCLTRVFRDPRYTCLRGLAVFLDTVLVLGEVSYSTHMAADRQRPEYLWVYPVISSPLCLFFWLDMIFTLSLEFPKFDLFFGRTGQRYLNLLAIVQQTLALIGAITMPSERFTSLFRTIISRINFLRIIRALLNLPGLGGKWLQKQIGELHIMIRALAGTVQPLVWCSVMVLIILTIFGTFFAESAAMRISMQHDVDEQFEEGSLQDVLMNNWGGLDRCVFTLFKAMLGGMDWGDAWDSLVTFGRPWDARGAFIIFICFTYIAFLNTVTAVFIQCAFVRLEKDKAFAVQRNEEEKVDYLCTAQELFQVLDKGDTGSIKNSDLVKHAGNPDVLACFQRLGLDTDQFEKLFVLMDTDGSDTTSMEEFMAGCLKLKGHAKSVDLEILHSDVRYVITHLENIDGLLANQTQLLQTPREEPVSVERQAQQLVRLQHDLRLLSAQLAAIERNVNLTIARSETEFALGAEVEYEPTISL